MLTSRLIATFFALAGSLAFAQSSAAAITSVRASAVKSAKPDLTGRIVSMGGQPISGAAVMIYTARPRSGQSVYCPSCYADCIKRATTDASGRFRIASLDRNLVFNVLVVKHGWQPTFQDKVDPRDGAIQVKLPASPPFIDPRHIVSGRVLGPDGSPVIGAKVTPVGIDYAAGGGSVGMIEDADPIAITNERGEFAIHCNPGDAKLKVIVDARGLASGAFAELKSGGSRDLTLTSGVTVTGRVLKDGKPLPNVTLGLVQANREVETFFRPMTIGTDSQGRFQFDNVAPGQAYFLYGVMQGMGGQGAIASREILAGADNSEVDAGKISVGPAHAISGRVTLTDSKTIPAGTRVMVGGIDAWDTQVIDLDDKGDFAASGLPDEPVHVSVSIPGYRLAARNTGFTSTDPDWLTITPSDAEQTIKIEMTPAK